MQLRDRLAVAPSGQLIAAAFSFSLIGTPAPAYSSGLQTAASWAARTGAKPIMAKGDPKLKIAADDWAPPSVNAQGFEVDGHGLPISKVARALQLAKDGKTADPAKPPLVTPDEIAAQNPDGVAKDQEAVAEYRITRDWGKDAKPDDFAQATLATSEVPVDGAPATGEGN